MVPFYTACGSCFYCVRGQASRCSKGELFGNSAPANTIPGGQAEYVRCPLAETTFVKAPTDIPEEMLVLMADIFPTGYFAAARFLKDLNERDRKEYTAVVIGCGPVGVRNLGHKDVGRGALIGDMTDVDVCRFAR